MLHHNLPWHTLPDNAYIDFEIFARGQLTKLDEGLKRLVLQLLPWCVFSQDLNEEPFMVVALSGAKLRIFLSELQTLSFVYSVSFSAKGVDLVYWSTVQACDSGNFAFKPESQDLKAHLFSK